MTEAIETVPEKDCETILSELAQLKLNGNEYLRINNGQMAGETYAQAIVTMRKLIASPRGKELRQTGGLEFINKLTDLCWVLHSNMAQACMQAIRENTHDRAIVNGMSDMLFRTIDQAMQIEQILRIWTILYRKTVGCRLVGSRERLEEGARAINMAMQLTPNDVAIEREARNIAELRMSL
ncbi:hypothetical protein HYALB_00013848 [Hymenoscyphus albidus]|uniref:Uncharacterized protein n=1 Tax=Hymenoscyphus albidus TaxID=595503 RepID=A0A9N9LZJ5_9HELO|nr:hypothetical protein HYALB_00013848 [Hymenoscyphus albidus]